MSFRRVATLLTASVLAVGALHAVHAPAQAAAETVHHWAALQYAVGPACTGTREAPTEVSLGDHISAPTNGLAVECDTELDLSGHTLAVRQLAIAPGTTLTVTGGTLIADAGAGIDDPAIETTGAHLVVADVTLTATGGTYAAAIGGSSGQDGGSVTVSGGTVTATGGQYGAGIGGGHRGGGGTITVSGGTVESTGGRYAAGLGSGHRGTGGTVTVTGGQVRATAGQTLSSTIAAAAIDGDQVDISQGAMVTATSVHSPIVGSVTVAGILWLPSGTQQIPDADPSGPELTVTETGRLFGKPDDRISGAAFAGDGQIDNQGAIALDPAAGGVAVTGFHYLITFDGNGGDPAIAQRRLYASSFNHGYGASPPTPTRSRHEFTGWTLDGEPFTDGTTPPGRSADGRPVALTAKATWGRLSTRVRTLQELVSAVDGNACSGTAEDPARIVLDDDLGQPYTGLSIGCPAHLDLNGRTLRGAEMTIASGLTLTVDDTEGGGQLVLDARNIGNAAGIHTVGGHLVVDGGTITAWGGWSAAGIGSNWDGNTGHLDAGSVTVNSGTVHATGGDYGAGIGGGDYGHGATVTINGGTVHATGGSRAAGIGGGQSAPGGSTTVNGGTVHATGGEAAAGIGGGLTGAGGSVTVHEGLVDARGGEAAAGIGSGFYATGAGTVTVAGGQVVATPGAPHPELGTVGISSGQVAIAEDGELTASAAAPDQPIVGDLWVAGTLRLLSGTQQVQDSSGTALRVTRTGRILGAVGTPDAGARFSGGGLIDNRGGIALDPVAGDVQVRGNHHLVTFDATGGAPATAQRRVYAPTLAAGHRDLPADPTRTGRQFTGWTLDGEPFTATTPLPGASTDGEPVNVAVRATWDELRLDRPVVTGVPVPGGRLSGTVTGLAPSDADVEWTWIRTAADGSGAPVTVGSGSGLPVADYAPTAADVGHRLMLRITASHPAYDDPAVRDSEPVTITHAPDPGPGPAPGPGPKPDPIPDPAPTAKLTITQVKPSKARPGQRVRIRVTGLGPRERYTVRLGTKRLARGRANRKGIIKLRLRIPTRTRAGKHRLRVTAHATQRHATTRLTVQRRR